MKKLVEDIPEQQKKIKTLRKRVEDKATKSAKKKGMKCVNQFDSEFCGW